MKYIWEPHDIRVGRHVQASNRTETWMIGYDAHEPGIKNMLLVSLTDGMVSRRLMTGISMADHLNEAGMRPVDVRQDDFWKGDEP